MQRGRSQTGPVVDVPVLVVGAGPVGVTAALLLAGRGVEVLVIERHRRPYGLPRAVHLDDEVLRVLQEAGVAESVVAGALPMAGLRLVDARLRTLAEFPRDPARRPNGWPPGVLFSQPRAGGGAARRGGPPARCHAADRGAAGRPHPGRRRRRRRAAAGGRRAGPVRPGRGTCSAATARAAPCASSTGGRMRDLGRPDRWLVIDARARVAAPSGPACTRWATRTAPATFMPLPGGRYRWEFRLRPGETAEELAAPGRLAGLLAPFGATDVAVERSAGYTYRAQVADRWRTGRVLLAGDAAHLTPPFIGQGLGLGLRDVHQLAWKLAAVLDGRAAPALLDTHQAERAPHARALLRVALLLGRLMTRGGRGAAAVRAGLLAGARRVPAVAALAVSTRTPPLRRGPLVDRRGRAGRRLAGTLVPQPGCGPVAGECRLDDVLGPGWAELARSPAGGLAVRRLPAGQPLARRGRRRRCWSTGSGGRRAWWCGRTGSCGESCGRRRASPVRALSAPGGCSRQVRRAPGPEWRTAWATTSPRCARTSPRCGRGPRTSTGRAAPRCPTWSPRRCAATLTSPIANRGTRDRGRARPPTTSSSPPGRRWPTCWAPTPAAWCSAAAPPS